MDELDIGKQDSPAMRSPLAAIPDSFPPLPNVSSDNPVSPTETLFQKEVDQIQNFHDTITRSVNDVFDQISSETLEIAVTLEVMMNKLSKVSKKLTRLQEATENAKEQLQEEITTRHTELVIQIQQLQQQQSRPRDEKEDSLSVPELRRQLQMQQQLHQ